MGQTDKRVTAIKNFCQAIVALSRPQRLFILQNISRKQCVYLKEISLNVLINKSIILSDKHRAYLKAKLADIKKLASHSVCFNKKKKIIEHHHLLIKKLCLITLEYFDKTR